VHRTESGVLVVESRTATDKKEEAVGSRPTKAAAEESLGTSTASRNEGAARVEELVVTAERRREKLQDVPIAISPTTGAQIEQANLRTLLDLSIRTPGLVNTTTAGYAQLFIRGIGTSTSNPGLETSVATYVDDLYVVQQIGSLFDLVDVDNIQVLKGPQGSLYGRNATGGAVLINTANPTDKLGGYVKAEYGRFNRSMTEAMVNVPVNDAFKFRLVGRYYSEDGYITNLASPSGKKLYGGHGSFVRGKVDVSPADNISVLLSTEYERRVEDLSALQNATPAPLCVPCALFGQVPPPANSFLVNQDTVPPVVTQSWQSSIRVNVDFRDLQFTSISGFRFQDWDGLTDTDAAVGSFQEFRNIISAKSISQEVRLASNYSGRFNFLAGALYSRDKTSYPTVHIYGSSLGGNVGLSGYNRVHENYYSAYGEVYFNVTDRLKLTAGGRYNNEDKTLYETSNVLPAPTGAHVKDTNFTPRAVLSYNSDIGTFYLSYDQGFKSGGINTPSFAVPQTVRPENIKAVEAGAKLDFLDQRLRTNTAVFHYWHHDLQVALTNIANGGQLTENAASAKTWGIEQSADLALTNEWQIGGDVSYLHAVYDSFPAASVLVPNTAGLGFKFTNANLTGTTLPHAPKWIVSGHVDYKTALKNGMSAGFSFTGRYTDGFTFFPGGGGPLMLDRQKSTFVANVTAFIDLTDNIRLGAYVNNLTNQYYYLNYSTRATGTIDLPAKPRTFGGTLKVTF